MSGVGALGDYFTSNLKALGLSFFGVDKVLGRGEDIIFWDPCTRKVYNIIELIKQCSTPYSKVVKSEL